MTAPRLAGGPRLFLGVFPPAGTSAGLEMALARTLEPNPGLSWVEPDRWHVTLAFLGNTRPEGVPALSEALGQYAGVCRPFGTVLQGIGAFPTAGEPQQIFAGVGDKDGSWESLAVGLRPLLAREGYPMEERPYRPHLTLGHVKDALAGRSAISRLNQGTGSFRVEWTVDNFQLVRSWTGTGPRYESLEEFKFGKA